MRLGLFDRVRRFARLHGRLRGRSGRAAGPSGPTDPAGYTSRIGPSSVSGYRGGFAPGDGAVSHEDPMVSGGPGHDGPGHDGLGDEPWPRATGSGRHRRDSEPEGGAAGAVRAGSARARVREAPPLEQAEADAGQSGRARPGLAKASAALARAGVRARTSPEARPGPVRAVVKSARTSVRARLPFTAPRAREQPGAADGRRHCGTLEHVIWRQWDAATLPPPEVVGAIDRLAELPERIKTRLADSLDAIFVGPGGVPELDEMTSLRGVRLPGGHASWDVCAGAYGERKIVVGSRPSPTPDVMCHEIGHALDDIDSPPGSWQSDSAEFRMLYDQCQPHFASDFHRQPGGLGRKEFFADAFAAIASGQRPALVDMLRGQTRTALRVMLYFNRRYDI
jgi:hypothetical protein